MRIDLGNIIATQALRPAAPRGEGRFENELRADNKTEFEPLPFTRSSAASPVPTTGSSPPIYRSSKQLGGQIDISI